MKKDEFLQFIDTSLIQLNRVFQVAIEGGVDKPVLDTYERLINHCDTLKTLVSKSELSSNYINQFQIDTNQTLGLIPFRNESELKAIVQHHKVDIKKSVENSNSVLLGHLALLEFNLNFFRQLGFLNKNIVAVGANGSGKTSLYNKLNVYIRNNGVVIAAQKILFVPSFDTLSNPTRTEEDLRRAQLIDKSNKNQTSLGHLHQEFEIVLKNLLANNIQIGNEYKEKAIEQVEKGQTISKPPVTKLYRTFEIWNSLIEHRKLKTTDGINLKVIPEEGEPYSAMLMSDGEKVVLFLIAQVLQAPESGFIVVDEPEMFLHKTILGKLWNILEEERQDCIFLYLTHDLDFATSRTTAKKIWIRSFIYPEKWVIEDIPENDLPEALLLELLGSRKNILFCEGNKSSIDEKIYNILFPEYTITPVDNCFAVINYTKAFNKIPNSVVKAFGIIDSDHHGTERLEILKPQNIFTFSMPEVENLLLDEEFLKVLAERLMVDTKVVEEIKTQIIALFEKDLELQISNFISAKINYYFKESHVPKGNTLNEINDNYTKFTESVRIQEWFESRKDELSEILKQGDYQKILSVFNHKGLKSIANKCLNISDFTDRAIKLLQFDPLTHDILKRYFPDELN